MARNRKPAPPVENMRVSVQMNGKSPDVPKPEQEKHKPQGENIKAEIEAMRRLRQPWNSLYSAIAELIDGNNTRDFNGNNYLTNEDPFRQDDVFEDTPAMAAQTCGAAFAGMMWPDGARSVKVELKHPRAKKDTESVQWNQRCNERFVSALDDPRSNLANAIGEYFDDNVKYGTTALTRVPGGMGPDAPVFRFDVWNVANFWIAEGSNRRVDAIAISWMRSAQELVKEFGYSKCSDKVREAYNGQVMDKRFEYVHLIKPRANYDKDKKGLNNAPIASIHYDATSDHVMKETGFRRRSFYVGRFYLRPGQLYAFSPASNALPAIYLANAIKEAIILATEKMLDPAMGGFGSDFMGNDMVDTSAGSYNVFEAPPAGWQGPPVFQLQNIGDPRTASALLEQLIESIKNHFFLDRLLDLNNATQMTAREAMIREAIRSTTLRTPVNRSVYDIFTPFLQDCWDDMLDMGLFGVRQGSVVERNMRALGQEPVDQIPQVIQELLDAGEEVFEIVFNNPAMRDRRASEAQAITDHIALITNVSPAYPQSRNALNIMRALDRIADIRGVPKDIQNSEDERTKIEAQQSAEAQENAVLQNLGQLANISKQLGVTGGGQ